MAQATVTADLADYIRGPFPAPEVGTNKGDANVADNDEDPIARLRDLWEAYKGEMQAYLDRALNPSAAPSYGVPGDE